MNNPLPNPVEWIAWLHGKFFVNAPWFGYLLAMGIGAAIFGVFWAKGVDQFNAQKLADEQKAADTAAAGPAPPPTPPALTIELVQSEKRIDLRVTNRSVNRIPPLNVSWTLLEFWSEAQQRFAIAQVLTGSPGGIAPRFPEIPLGRFLQELLPDMSFTVPLIADASNALELFSVGRPGSKGTVYMPNPEPVIWRLTIRAGAESHQVCLKRTSTKAFVPVKCPT